MSLGAAIGVGLFLGSASAIKLVEPGILLGYAFSGIIMLFIMRALGEMAIQKPIAGSFSQYARDYLGPLAGYITGWNYWFLWVVTCMAEITATAIYMEFWFPNSPRWIWALAALVIMAVVNFLAVKAYENFKKLINGSFNILFLLITVINMSVISQIVHDQGS